MNIPIDYTNYVDDGIFDYSFYGKTMFRPRHRWRDRLRDDLITFDPVFDIVELYTVLVSSTSTSDVIASISNKSSLNIGISSVIEAFAIQFWIMYFLLIWEHRHQYAAVNRVIGRMKNL